MYIGMTTPAQREANIRYRAKNYEKIKLINNKSNRKAYDNTKEKFKVKARASYIKRRNYIDIENMGKSLNLLFEL
jgi:N12 class adenine-specific DNA methylase